MRKNKLAQTSSILFILNMTASVLNYICQLLMARTLSVGSFGTINTIFSFMLIIAVPGTTLTMIVARYYASAVEITCPEKKRHYIRKVLEKASILTCITFIAFIILAVPIGKLLSIDNWIVLLLAFVLAATGFYQPIYSGVFTGNRCFVWVGLYSLLIPSYKILSVVVACIITDEDVLRLYLILFVMIIGTVATILIGHHKTTYILGSFSMKKEASSNRLFIKDDLYALVLNICLMIYMNIDLLCVRYFEVNDESGLYSAVLLFGRVLYYFSTTLGTILLPAAAVKDIGEKEKIATLNKAILCLLAFSVLCMVPINIGKRVFIELLYGVEYLRAIPYVKYISLISIALSLCTVLANYLVGIGRAKFAATIMMTVNILVVLYAIIVRNVTYILGGIGIIGIVGVLIIYFFGIQKYNNRKSKNI